MIRVIAGTMLLFAVGAEPPMNDFDFLKYAITQGGLVVVVLVLLWSYRKDLKAMGDRQDERIKILTDLVSTNTQAMTRATAASEANEKAAHRLSRALEQFEERRP